MKKKGGIFSTIILIVLLFGLLGGLIVGALYLTNGGRTDIRLYDIVTDDKIIDNTQFYLRDDNTPLKFKAIPKIDKIKIQDLKVRAVPSVNSDSAYIQFFDGERRKLSNCKDFTAMFNIDINNDMITVSTDWNINKYLANYYVLQENQIELIDFKSGVLSYIDLQFIIGDLTISCGLIDFVSVTEIVIDNDNILIEGEL